MLLKDFLKTARERLSAAYSEAEVSQLVSRLCEHYFHVQPYTHILTPDIDLGDVSAADSALARLCGHEPLQYVLGFEEFCGRRFAVDGRVLIPRPETEQLCGIALDAARSPRFAPEGPSPFGSASVCPDGLRILDLCTGSGCIAWTMALELPGSRVTAVDLSQDALDLASSQAFRPANAPRFFKADVLAENPDIPGGPFDIILSNPPYVTDSQKAQMSSNVLDWEPAMALFVPDGDPLRFYKKIAKICRRQSATAFWGGVEVNEAFADGVKALFEAEGFSFVRVLKDFRGRDRFVVFS